MASTKVKRILITMAVVGVVLLGGGFAAYRGYVTLRQARLIKQARNYLAKSNDRQAFLCLARARRYNPNDVEACRLMAQLCERTRSPVALVMRGRVVELQPDSLDDRLELARTALLFRDSMAATNALEGVSAQGKATAAYHNVAGTVDSFLGHFAQAEVHFAQAARLEPANPAPRLNLAVVRLHGTNDAALAQARTSLQEIVGNPSEATARCTALRELLADAARFRKLDAALLLSKQLIEDTNAGFSDRLLRLEVLGGTTNAGFKGALEALQREASSNGTNVYELGVWLMTKLSAATALDWLNSLPANTLTNLPVTSLIADCLSMRSDWKAAQQWLSGQYWADIEFTRHALLSRALRGQNLQDSSKAEWELALKGVNGQKALTIMLFRLATKWKWQSEAEELLWTIVNLYPQEQWAPQALVQALYSAGRTRPLMQLLILQSKRSPSDLDVKNNLAATALLLDAQEFKPHDLALDTYQRSPTNASFVSTYALSLYLQQKNQEALKVMEKLEPKYLEHPAIAGYYGLILKATGNHEKAQIYLNQAFKGSMLPEERKLFAQARTGT